MSKLKSRADQVLTWWIAITFIRIGVRRVVVRQAIALQDLVLQIRLRNYIDTLLVDATNTLLFPVKCPACITIPPWVPPPSKYESPIAGQVSAGV